eukprot:Phypoly_transcript_12421.p2 GENE.Phypoly_transcript_12421~~Phypoly_transcript_12421.p2  ORF type:complete len:104 (+),score=17.14 Phypoly_transcript_12421:245-556(+)
MRGIGDNSKKDRLSHIYLHPHLPLIYPTPTLHPLPTPPPHHPPIIFTTTHLPIHTTTFLLVIHPQSTSQIYVMLVFGENINSHEFADIYISIQIACKLEKVCY